MASTLSEFEQFLVERSVTALELAVTAGVRYLTVWNAMKGKSITPEQAAQIRKAAHEMTGVPYIGSLVISADKPIEQMPTMRVKKMTTHL